MGKKNKKNKKESKFSLNIKTQRLIVAIILIVVAIILYLGLIGIAGVAGEFLTLSLKIILGWASWLAPFVLLVIAFLVFNYQKVGKLNNEKEKKHPCFGARCSGLIALLIVLAGIFHLYFVDNPEVLQNHQAGGYIGYGLAYLLVNTFGFWASWVILFGALIISVIIAFAGFKFLKEKEKKKKEEKKEELFLSENWLKRFFYKLKSKFKKKGQLTLKPENREQLLEKRSSEEELEEGSEEVKVKIKKKNIFSKTKKDSSEQRPVFYIKTGQKIDLPLDLLEDDASKPNAGDIKENKLIIRKTLENFNISVQMGEVKVGPTVTQYTLKPAKGVKLSKITSLHNDLALALAAHPIRIEAPIPGQSLVGIEVPNQKIAVIRLRKILSDPIFKKRKSNLFIGLGRDVAGSSWLANLGKMPHLLVAGSTGSGKTIFLNSVIISLIYQNSPDDLRFILVDPKRVELTLYNDLPHLLTPVITNTQKTINALKWAINEMERRFDIMAENKKRDINSYNQSFPNNKLPYIVIIIDELADLMAAASQEVEACIVRLAQMARATGIHLVVATQRPSVDVITGLIKANITARVAFSVASLMDSRTILDFSGAEKLLGRGDMLFISAELSKPKRIQGAFVSDKEVKGIVEHLRNISKPHFQKDITVDQKVENLPGASEGADLKEDELLPEARDLVIQAGKASASFLQRRLRVGYARAARLLDLLEEEGTIGPADGAKPRDVYRSPEEILEEEVDKEETEEE